MELVARYKEERPHLKKQFKEKRQLLLIDSEKCDMTTYNTSNNFFQHDFSIQFETLEYPVKWCPYFFRNSKTSWYNRFR